MLTVVYCSRMCSLTTEAECVLLPQNVFSYSSCRRRTCAVVYCSRMCSLTTECVLLPQNMFSYRSCRRRTCAVVYCSRMCSLTTECVLLPQRYHRMLFMARPGWARSVERGQGHRGGRRAACGRGDLRDGKDVTQSGATARDSGGRGQASGAATRWGRRQQGGRGAARRGSSAAGEQAAARRAGPQQGAGGRTPGRGHADHHCIFGLQTSSHSPGPRCVTWQ